MLAQQGFKSFRLWPRVRRTSSTFLPLSPSFSSSPVSFRRSAPEGSHSPAQGVDVDLFRPAARDFALRQSWGVEPLDLDEDRPSPRFQASSSITSNDDLPPLSLPPPYTANPSPFSPSSSSSKLVCLYVGRVSWEKNLRLLIEAFRGLQDPDVATGRPACQLVFVGDGPARGEAEALCQTYGLGALFLGFRKGEELAAAYASADIFTFPSLCVLRRPLLSLSRSTILTSGSPLLSPLQHRNLRTGRLGGTELRSSCCWSTSGGRE
jgi:glycosyltransferase involved in cell wall biosynthesis